MATIRVTHTLDDLRRDLEAIPGIVKRRGRETVRRAAVAGNQAAKAHASVEHGYPGDEDADYPPSFTVEQTGALRYEYGPDAAIGDGSKATGYEFGSRNSPPHGDLAYSRDVARARLSEGTADLVESLFWTGGEA